ncbi:sensor histidine kinase [Asticcacaulis taihuensis]|uniref:histidine kinase n=1 Tax=Asticcacaulis taihuensis TaxID=260084 RepID=A0A1G4Q587_9CAUL|nr:histidine kinase dimerization/phospho-acceptor domain-containing protein [Asticcacaulis taihuensis]SCW39595.1 His Kinase A (phospho-acceptor) domain-containing protein [Asticcacaulis taihuensis]
MVAFSRIRQYRKLPLIVAALCAPLLLLAVLFANQSFKAIHFTDQERLGVAYLRPVRELLSAIDAGKPPEGNTLAAAAERLNRKLALQADYEAFMQVLDDRSAGRAQTTAAGRAFLTQIADASNLTLDPHIDSYYLMNTAVNLLPDTDVHSAAVMDLLAKTATGGLTENAASLNSEIALLDLAASNSRSSIASAIRGNPDGKVSAAVTPDLTRFNAAENAFHDQAERMASQIAAGNRPTAADLGKLKATHAALMSSTDALWHATTDELERLLKARSHADLARLWLLLGLSAIIALAAIGLTFYFDLYIQHDEVLKLNATLRQSNEELERFAFICSHDLQEPVRMMNLYASFLAEAESVLSDNEAMRYVGKIRDSAEHMRRMISDILTFSQIGREPVETEAVDCNAVLQSVLAEFADTIIRTSATVNTGPLPVLITSPTLVQSVAEPYRQCAEIPGRPSAAQGRYFGDTRRPDVAVSHP